MSEDEQPLTPDERADMLRLVARMQMGGVEVLPETERLVREFLPTKSKAYPAQQLDDEVAALRDHLATHG